MTTIKQNLSKMEVVRTCTICGKKMITNDVTFPSHSTCSFKDIIQRKSLNIGTAVCAIYHSDPHKCRPKFIEGIISFIQYPYIMVLPFNREVKEMIRTNPDNCIRHILDNPSPQLTIQF